MNAIVEYLDYQIPVNQMEIEICKQQSETEMRHLPLITIYNYVGGRQI